MLNVTPIRGNNQYAAAHYFSAADDYYAKEHPGEWQGQGAQALGLTGPVEQAQLSRLLDGQLPNGERIQTTFDPTDNKKRMGLDLTFSAPKSVSMQALVAGDKDVTAAHDRAVTRALEQVERLAEARKKVKGKSYRERTANMVIGKFRHEMSRAKDPQLHTHAVVLNMTQRADGAWRALSNEDIFRVQHEVDALYKAELARGLQALGYAIRLVDDQGNFELDHISRDQIEAFSARSRVIEEALANEGKTRATATTLEKQIISLATRPRKDESDRELVKQYWVEKSRELGIDYGLRSQLDGRTYEAGDSFGTRGRERGDAGDRIAATSLPASLTPAQAVVQYAINHLTEREAVVRETALTATALRRAVGLAGPDEVRAEIKRLAGQGALIEAVPAYRMADRKDGPALSSAGWKSYLQELKGWSDKQAQQYVGNAIKQGSLVPAEKRYTTQKALAREKAILAIERTGRGAIEPIMTAAAVKTALEGTALSAGQRSAVETIVSTKNRFVGIQGDAGTGKTYTVNQAVALIKQASAVSEGYRTVALAPYGNQVKALKNEGLEAHTLASFLRTKDKPIDGKTIIVLDESGVVGARQMEQVMRVVEKAGARMVLLGDTKQTEAIEAGKPFAQLQQDGMQTARISEIQRQKDHELKTAVEHAAEGRVTPSLAHIKHVEELKEPIERHRAIVNDYIQLTEPERRETLIVAGTNEARREINRMVRQSLDLTGKGREFETLTRVDMTQAQRRFAPSYQPGMVIQPEKDDQKAGLTRGETYRVKDALPGNALVLQRQDGTTTTINPRKATQLSVYRLERAELSVGDTVRINRNDPGRDLTNGDRMRVAGVIGGVVKLESVEQRDGRPARALELPTNRPLHLEHAYASTVHSAQGLTNDRALIALDTNSRTTSMNLYYVAISRACHEARVYTNSVKELPAAIARRFDKTTALAIQRERQLQRRDAGMQPKGAADGKQALQRQQFQQQRKQPASGKKPSEYGRFG
ncbi:conjugative relaxase [Xanthomonas euvesicatoria pv. euvesicatoria]|uniref:Conjugative relaxase-like TrwC/TraI family protein n=11 Tax=Xanthomonas TaxID=338 RepID=A0AB73H3L5_9XANT|nr:MULTISPECIES: MobF family relaxase [Xanthomonas]AOY69511.1 AAA family ATPase [Xanthomonas euvesicatoria pv. vesicatoria str. 85-10]APO88961.1 AAA family ATPase [Xanthomonas euvesicatoria]KLA50548.1 ATPase AAA [Xanthomonas euvesicatoria]KLA50617.1 ATPase AAA [Xanthomonas euvesicatoria]KLA58145.1 ATPase AAA [Xanthomonas euvesicatoria]